MFQRHKRNTVMICLSWKDTLPWLCLQDIRATSHARKVFRKEKLSPTMNHWRHKGYFLILSVRSDELTCRHWSRQSRMKMQHSYKKHPFICESTWVCYAVDSSSSVLPVSFYPFLTRSQSIYTSSQFPAVSWCFRHFYCTFTGSVGRGKVCKCWVRSTVFSELLCIFLLGFFFHLPVVFKGAKCKK